MGRLARLDGTAQCLGLTLVDPSRLRASCRCPVHATLGWLSLCARYPLVIGPCAGLSHDCGLDHLADVAPSHPFDSPTTPCSRCRHYRLDPITVVMGHPLPHLSPLINAGEPCSGSSTPFKSIALSFSHPITVHTRSCCRPVFSLPGSLACSLRGWTKAWAPHPLLSN
jgi:hypothetical protein